jgi:hypothetical protein
MFNKIYTNGCSFTCAGGLDDLNVRKKYKEILNIELSENYIQYAYSNIIGKKLQLSVHNDAVSGGSVNGLIRKTYEYVYKNQSKISETLFILELPPMWRDEVYSNELGVIMNVNVSTVENPQSGIPAAIEHPVGDIKNLSKNLQSYFYNFINTEFEYKKSMNNLLGLLCFLKNNDVNLYDLMKSLGHKQLTTTQVYIQNFKNKRIDDMGKGFSDIFSKSFNPNKLN